MYLIQVDAKAAQETVDSMIHQLTHFTRIDIGQVMSDWQTEDMHRQRPFTMRNRGAGRATTIVRPHSRFEVNRSRMAQRRIARRAKSKKWAGVVSPFRKWSTRPILRSEMMDDLVRRAQEALAKIKWKQWKI